jgi:glycosyltransferase involved in cell wall biosynthesis
VVSEAAALGTPTIAYDVPGLRDSTRAAGGVVVPPSPAALSRWLVELLPSWYARDTAPLPHGGAHSWDDVAASVLAAVRLHARAPRTPRALQKVS